MKPKICVVVPAFTYKQTLEEVKNIIGADLIEIRFDFRVEDISVKELRKLSEVPLIATNRCQSEGGFAKENTAERINLLIDASKAGYEYVDIEFVTPNISSLVSTVHEAGSLCIVSNHNFSTTPSLIELKKLYNEARHSGADIVKLVGTANSYKDNLVYLSFLKESPGNISFGMGEQGIISRLISPIIGGAFTYASSNDGSESAPGQLTLEKMQSIYQSMGVFK